jgi:uncharacterized membrane protein
MLYAAPAEFSELRSVTPGTRESRDRWAAIPDLAITFGILVAVAAAAGLGISLLTLSGETRASFVGGNEITAATRGRIALAIAVAVALVAASGVAALVTGRFGWERLGEIARRLAPIIPVALLPALLSWRAWDGRLVTFAFAAVAVGWLTVHTVAVAGRQPPLSDRWPRLEGRAEALNASRLGRALPWIAVIAAALGYSLYFSWATVQGHRNGLTMAFDLGIFDNLHWNLIHGGGFFETSTGMGPEGGSHFGRHATWFAYLIAPIYAIREGAETLLAIQAFLLGFAAVPLYGFARHHLPAPAAVLLAVAYLLYPPLHGSNLYDFHFLTLTPFFAFLLAWSIERGRAWEIAVAVALTLSVREDAAFIVAILGAWQLISRRNVRLGAVLIAAGVFYFALMKFVLMPLFIGGPTFAGMYRELIPPGGRGFGGVLETLVSNPLYAFRVATAPAKLEYALLIGAPILFVALRRPIGALFVVPGVLFTLLASKPAVTEISFQYTAFWTPYLFIAAAVVLSDRGFPALTAEEVRLRRRAWLCGVALATLVCSYQYGAVLQRNTAAGGFHDRYAFTTTEEHRALRRDRADIIAALPPDASVSASRFVTAHVTGRRRAYDLRYGPGDAEYVIMKAPPAGKSERRSSREVLSSGEFGVVGENETFILLRRGAPVTDVPRVFRRVIGRRMKPAERARLVEPGRPAR